MLRELAMRLGFTKPKPPVLKKGKKSVAEKRQELTLNKITIIIDGDMIPLSDINYKGKLYKEARRLPRKIRTGILDGLTLLHKEGFDSLEFSEQRGLILTKGTKLFRCNCTYRYLMKEPYAALKDALGLLSERLREQ